MNRWMDEWMDRTFIRKASTKHGYHFVRWSREQKNIISLSLFLPEILISRTRFIRPDPRQPAHSPAQAEVGAYSRDFTNL